MLWLCSGTLMSFLCRPHRRRACNWITLWPVTPPHHCPAGFQSIDRHRRTSLLEERRDTYSSWTGGWLGRGEREGCSYSISGVEHWISCIAISIGIIGISCFYCMLYQVLRVLPSNVETRDQNSRGCPLLFSNRNLGSFCA